MKKISTQYLDQNIEDKEMRLNYQKIIGKRVRVIREQKKWTQERLAQEIHINEKYVYDIEVGNKCMSMWTLIKIAKAFEIDINTLIYSL